MNKIKLILILTAFCITVHPKNGSAEIKPIDIVNNFILAVQTHDKQKLNTAINELTKDFKAQDLLKNNWPDYFTLFNLYKISKRIETLKKEYGLSSLKTISPLITTPNSSQGLRTNKDLAFSKNLPNRVIARDLKHISNGELVRQSLNQDQESNQERINRRR